MSEESKVRLWIWGGFLSVLLLLAVVGAVSYVSFENTVGRFAESGRVSQSTVQVMLADRNVASLRSYAQQYLSNGVEEKLKNYQNRKDIAFKALDEALKLSDGAELRLGIQRINELSTSFDSRFRQAISLRARKIQLVKDTDAIGHKIRDRLDEYNKVFHSEAAVEAVETLMRSRLDLARISEIYRPDKAKEGVDLAVQLVAETHAIETGLPPDRRGKLTEVFALADAYAAGLATTIEAILELEKLTDEVMEAIGKEISATTLKVRTLQAARQTEIDHAVGGFVFNAKLTIGSLTLVAILLGLICALLISTKVSRPIRAMATAADVAEEIGELIKLAAQDGDFRNRATTEGRTGFVATISHAVNRLFDSICLAFNQIGSDAGKVALAASDASGAVVEVNAGAAEQARSLDQVRDAIRMSAEAITKVSGSATEAREISDQASELANRGQITIEEMANLMEASYRANQDLLRISHALGHTVSKVDYLAASVLAEAFKLGGPGQSFAAICQQVCALTQETHESAASICSLVEAANHDLAAGAQAATSARQLIKDMRQRVSETDRKISSIAETMLAQQSAILEIDATTNSLAEIGEHNVEAGEQISRRLVELRDISNQTKAAIAAFKIELPTA